jgi:hypothetical protein
MHIAQAAAIKSQIDEMITKLPAKQKWVQDEN